MKNAFHECPILTNTRRFIMLQLYGVYDGRCFYCGNKIKLTELSCDHRQPATRGGTDDPDNWELSCLRCNARKGHMTVKEFFKFLGIEQSPIFKEHPKAIEQAAKIRSEATCTLAQSKEPE